MNTRRAWIGTGLMAGVIGGTVIGLALANGSADEQTPTVETTETTTVQATQTVQVTEVVPAAPTSAASTDVPAVPAPTVEAVTTPEPVAPQPVQPYVAPAPAEPQPQVTQGEGIVEGPSTSFDATRAPQAEPLPGTTEGVNDSDNHPVG